MTILTTETQSHREALERKGLRTAPIIGAAIEVHHLGPGLLESAYEKLLPVHEAQLLTYLKLSGKRVELLINFYVSLLTRGIVRKVL